MIFEGLPGMLALYQRANAWRMLANPRRLLLDAERRRLFANDLRAQDVQQRLYDTGDLATHRDKMAAVLDVDPWNPTALAFLSLWGSDATVARLRILGQDTEHMGAYKPYERALIWYGLARYHERRREYDEAWWCYESAGEIVAELFEYDADAADALVDKFVRRMDRRMLRGPVGCTTRKPIFIVGLCRSGTTLMEQCLACHPSIHPLGELMFLQEATRAHAPGHPMTDWKVWKAGASYLRRCATYDPRILGHKRFTDKMPGNWMFAPMIPMALPNARIVWMQRDPVDNLVSNWRSPLYGHGWTGTMEGLAHKWRAKERVLGHLRHAAPPGVLHVVQYEDLVTQPEEVLRGVLDHVGLPWDPAVLHPEAAKQRRIATASTLQARRPIHPGSVGRWSTTYADHLAPLRELLTSTTPTPEALAS